MRKLAILIAVATCSAGFIVGLGPVGAAVPHGDNDDFCEAVGAAGDLPDPSDFDPENFDPENFDPENFDPENFDPENFDPGSFDPGSSVVDVDALEDYADTLRDAADEAPKKVKKAMRRMAKTYDNLPDDATSEEVLDAFSSRRFTRASATYTTYLLETCGDFLVPDVP